MAACLNLVTHFLRPHGRYTAAELAEGVWAALVPNLLGLGLALVTTVGHRYLSDRCDDLEREMRLALLELPTLLRRLGGGPTCVPVAAVSPAVFAERAARRRLSSEVSRFGRGLPALYSIASAAPLVGLCGTCLWIAFYTFRGGSFSRSSGIAMVGSGLSEALLFNAAGLLLAIAASWAAHWIASRQERLAGEMQVAIADLAALLANGRAAGAVLRP